MQIHCTKKGTSRTSTFSSPPPPPPPPPLFNFRPSKLFVFGDSYADTGNNKKSEANSWKYPYGITFPGNQLVVIQMACLTDFLDYMP
ncbi:gdsl esterase/lipase [Quercus suber]|uniref:Gdsl esterase/lipase n=1 Tax=Quercus suber TaxID=58331 RepID=A0AAW0J879_QUESU